MALGSNNPFPSVLLVEGSAPASPASGDQRIFLDSADHKLKRVNSSGVVTTIEGGSGGSGLVAQVVIGALAADNTGLNSTTAWTDFPNLSVSITTSGSGHRLQVQMQGTVAISSSAAALIHVGIKVNSTVYPVGTISYSNGNQVAIAGFAIDTPASSGAQTVKVVYYAEGSGASCACRVASYPNYEQMKLMVTELTS